MKRRLGASGRPAASVWAPLVAAAVLLVAGCGGGAAPAAQRQAPAGGKAAAAKYAVRWAAQEVPEDFVYRGRDFASRYGLRVAVEVNPSAAKSLQDLIAGRVDVADTGSAPALSAMERDPGKLIIVSATHSGGQREGVLVKKGSPYTSVRQLFHQKVAIPVGSGAYIAWEGYLQKKGWTDADFQIVNMQPPDMANALSAGQVAAVVPWEPTPSILITKGLAREIVNFADVTTDPALMVTSVAFARSHAAALERFLASMDDMYAFIRQHPKQAGQVAAQVEARAGVHVPAAAFARAFGDMTMDMNVTSADLQALRRVAGYMEKIGKLSAMPDFSRLVDDRYLRAAQAMAGGKGQAS